MLFAVLFVLAVEGVVPPAVAILVALIAAAPALLGLVGQYLTRRKVAAKVEEAASSNASDHAAVVAALTGLAEEVGATRAEVSEARKDFREHLVRYHDHV